MVVLNKSTNLKEDMTKVGDFSLLLVFVWSFMLTFLSFFYSPGEKKFDLSVYDTYCLASTLKQFFRDLPEPIFTYELHNQFLKNTGKKKKSE